MSAPVGATLSIRRRGAASLLRSVAARLGPQEWFGLSMTGLFVVLMVIGPVIAPYPTEDSNPAFRLLPPRWDHLLGTDENGMDVFSRILAAPRVDVSVGLSTALIAVTIGISLGVLAGFFEGSDRKVLSLLGQGLMRLLDVVQAFPVFILALVLVAVRGAAVENIILAIVFVNVPVFLRLARSEMLTLRERLFAEAARAVGNSDVRIAFRHLLPNALAPLMNQVSVTVGFAILLTAGLSFVGAGVAPPTPELGAMISTGAKYTLLGYWWVGVFPGVVLGVVVFSFAVTGEVLGRLLVPGALAEDVQPEDAGPTIRHNGVSAPAGQRPEGLIPATAATGRGAMQAAVPLFGVEDLVVEFIGPRGPKRVLDGVSLALQEGETVGIVGESGSGKSVLVRALLLLLPEDGRVKRGVVSYRGRNLIEMDPSELRRLRGTEIAPILPGAREQLNPVVTIGEMMCAVVRAHIKASRDECRQRAVEALSAVGIPDPARRLSAYPHELSGGMAQRVCIALALLHRPSLIIADEPTSGLDVTVTRQVLDVMAKVGREHRTAQLIVTRDLGIVAQYCGRIAVMQAGRLVEVGPTAEVFEHPRDEYTRRLISSTHIGSRVLVPAMVDV
jgi:peptide/nickel transport system permease protein